MKKNRSDLEIQISSTLVQFEKEYMGRGPVDIKTYLFDDIVFIRLKGVLTKAETQLASGGSKDNRDLIKRVRIELLEKGRPLLEAIIENILNRKVVSLHTDISTRTGERLIIFTLNEPLNDLF
ncbi:MAG TPA: DUF2294 domain-containing protein [Atribacter sp.]|jgi:uncharacterized protein YbcI|uniref:Na+-translocating membrane potential-generating system MpsC domain-containing protein n=1 Tax=Candidatus Atribacter allofermentans TaxID=1852833 RepID=A0A1V5SIL6_9BACT|nr:DUF2294 domain-containing protein [Atribacter sp.]MDD3713904.1 DUF2294 domain-containing protein [Atribacterota bacterium]OQA54348.1 MAG: hypothetical protein BWY41_02178 [Candidatus Atribacteria bacterium ADurb.Bin276]HHT10743.1 DUF2294 domain-containing protein [Candidatus Atribacteria bacterium]HOT04654.1 DUF2294 domain-containing protein [Atribacter sp.]HQK82653.1 DUF2294 domain-containing protein [Atribacter sp.]